VHPRAKLAAIIRRSIEAMEAHEGVTLHSILICRSIYYYSRLYSNAHITITVTLIITITITISHRVRGYF
jgi:hypothetical protein